MSNQTFGRGQAEWALWKSFTVGRSASDDVPKVFRTRVKRLLDVDREHDFAEASDPPPVRWSFVAPPEESGAEAAYTSIDVFCLAIGLDLLDAGFKQSEIVFLMRYLRPELEARLPGLVERPSLHARQRYKPEVDPSRPTFGADGRRYLDARQFVVLSKIELREIVPQARARAQKTPLFLEPDFCDGIEALSAVLSDAMPNRRRVVTVLELTATAQAVSAFLEQAPSIRRGRPKA
ncbi:hypothetical protein [Ruegeria arenilitoris]|uniref:hypothetical protein n=1 Tax=Ruegeria arenilitoris TaxID=1173585 RepID=UPI001480AD93|nr:hypothetical protein [Ruegeria arenilitoris]